MRPPRAVMLGGRLAMMRALFSFSFAAIVAWLFWVLTPTAVVAVNQRRYQPTTEGETFSITKLGPSEQVAIVFRSSGCFHYTERLYQINGGTPPRFGIKELKLSDAGREPSGDVVIGALTDQEMLGLEAYLMFLRHGFAAASTTRDNIVVGYYRAGRKVGEERFRDTTGLASQIYWSEGKIQRPQEVVIADFPEEVFREIIPPTVIEQRLKPDE